MAARGIHVNKRDVVRTVLDHRKPPYVPWSFGFTIEAKRTLERHYGGAAALEEALGNHILGLGNDIGFFEPVDEHRVRDVFGVVWNREIDKDIGVVEGSVLPEPSLEHHTFPDPRDERFFTDIPRQIHRFPDRFRVFSIGFSLFERAWTLRGMENLLIDFIDNRRFVRELFTAIADYNIAQVERALEFDIDAIYFGDDWGQQRGLLMGPEIWRSEIKPVLARMYGRVKAARKYVMIHSCGDVDELFDDLIEVGLDCFNPFQPEVMDVFELLPRYRDRLSLHGGLSTQRLLPFGTPEQGRTETERLIELGSAGGYILSPAHAVEGDVSLPNMLAFIDRVNAQI